jgi:hypothetical protein
MPVFQPGTVVDTGERAEVLVEAGQRPLSVGRHRFQLVVIDDAGNESAPAFCDVTVIDNQRPTAIITPAQLSVAFNTNFTLSGANSTDIGGRIVRYRWTLID